MRTWIVAGMIVVAAGLVGTAGAQNAMSAKPDAKDQKKMEKKTEIATFAGGCFWCMQTPFDDVKGVKATTVGYTGGTKKNPTYEEVGGGKTGHCESIEIEFDPNVISYAQMLDVYWHNIDPTSGDGQFCDRGNQYRPEIFYHGDEQKRLAEESKKKVEEKFGTVPVQIVAATTFYPAEEYHQKFYMKNPDRYHEYRTGCGRDRRLKELWGDQAGH
jgi:peptide-methionine (S)-S-oxide reductase